ncbi:restriction endonuclease subunit S [Enterobacter sp. Tr-810]|uniref:restriction endonuclease subunit S n=1 Tax=Enterobacter sp. Tr-810 TaxID=2608347 RepID=UPI0014194967|nr:restriction endonuclease subunit S [Enterobacter sp. Tr-810]NIF37846.1 restriction endonuclease subunit S [Enterobacter sp. Tr-810]
MNLPTYGSYKKSNIIWVGNYPSEWFITKVKYEAYVKARVGWHGLKSDDFTDEGPFLVTGSDFKSSRIHWADCYHCDLNRYEQDPYIQLRNGDLLITKDGTIGKVALIDGLKPNEKATLNSGVFVVRPLVNNFSTKFYFWLLQSKVFTDFVDYNKTGSTIVHLYQDTFVNFSYASPQLKEQIQIAAFLDHETVKIDNLIEKQQQLIEMLKEKRQAVISHAVTKGLNPDVPMKDSGVEWLGEVPEHWDVLRLKHLISSLESGCSVNAADIPAQQGEVAVLKTSCVYTRSFRANENKIVVLEDLHRVKCPVRKGSIIISRMNTPDLVGASALVDVDAENIYLPDRLWQTNFNSKLKLIPAYLAHFMTTQGFRTQISLGAEGASSSMQNIAKDDYLSINCLLPSIEEQQEITSFLEEKLSYFSDLELRSSEIIQLLQERRTALISAAVTGKIDVRDWVSPETQDVEEPQEATA